MKLDVRRTASLTGSAALAVALALGGGLTSSATAADAYNVTVSGIAADTPLVALAPSSTQAVVVSNLPANVGLRILHCKTPIDPRTSPTLCDNSTGAVNVLAGDPAGRGTATVPIKVNAEFWGVNPDPTAKPTAPGSVDCRVPSADPRSATCTLYVLGSGRDGGNPAYIKMWSTLFSAVRPDRRADVATITLSGKLVTGSSNKLVMNAPTPFEVKMQSGLAPTLSSDQCSLNPGKITALASTGTCTVLITTTGGKNYRPFVATQVFQLVLS